MMSLWVSQSQLVFPEESDTGGLGGGGGGAPSLQKGRKKRTIELLGNGFCVVGGGKKRGLLQFAYM